MNIVAVLGAGSWGITLATLLHCKGCSVRLWDFSSNYVKQLALERENSKYLPGVRIHEDILVTTDLRRTVEGATTIVLAVVSQKLRNVLVDLHPGWLGSGPVINVAKGIELGTGLRMSQVITMIRPEVAGQIAVLSGPSLAEEVSRGIPTALVIAASEPSVAQAGQDLFMTPLLRVYTSDDMPGVELGGSLKNIIAIGAGIVDGLGLGENTKAALITRGLAEMERFACLAGALTGTLHGLSGLGDLVVTCISRHSRNRHVGECLGQGRRLSDILAERDDIAEGVLTTRAVSELAKIKNIEMPITQQLYEVLFESKDPRRAIVDLMAREAKPEHRS